MAISPLDSAVSKVGDRWSLLVIEALLKRPSTFGELSSALPGIAPNVLSGRLKQLERERVVVARAYSRRPPRFSYALTAAGEELGDALRLLAAWGAAHGETSGPPAHSLCGTALAVSWFCPTCDAHVADPESDELRYA